MFQIQFLKKWADKKAKGEDGRSDVPPKTYFQEDEDLAEYDPKYHYSSIEMCSVQCYPVQQS